MQPRRQLTTNTMAKNHRSERMPSEGESLSKMKSLRSRDGGAPQMMPRIEQEVENDGDMDGGNPNPSETSFGTNSKQGDRHPSQQ